MHIGCILMCRFSISQAGLFVQDMLFLLITTFGGVVSVLSLTSTPFNTVP